MRSIPSKAAGPSKRIASHLVLAASLTLALLSGSTAFADVKEQLQAAMTSADRSDADKARDANRRPVETLTFFRLQPDMRVLELLPGGGWYTRLLAPVLADSGELFVAIGTQGVEAQIRGGVLRGVQVVPMTGKSNRPEGSRRSQIDGLELNVHDIDLALTFRNLHNFTESGRQAMNDQVFKALKPGGLYGVVDHTRRHMQADDNENARRMDPVQMIKEIEAAGFEFVDYSDLHYRADDELRYEVGRKTVTGNTDRFTLLFTKP